MSRFPVAIQDFGHLFVEMQHKRHTADYDPEARFNKSDVIKDIDRVEDVISDFPDAPIKDRRAFAIYVLLNQRRS